MSEREISFLVSGNYPCELCDNIADLTIKKTDSVNFYCFHCAYIRNLVKIVRTLAKIEITQPLEDK
jgi:hypothetical protein